MNTQEIINGYAAANTKSNYVNKLSKEMGVPKSQIICELFKSGYKYHELQRMMPNDYKAAEKKYQKRLDEQETEKSTVSNTGVITADVANENEELNGAYQKALSDVVRLTEELIDANKAIEVLRSDKAELNSIADKHAERIRGLETELEKANNEKSQAENHIQELQIRLAAEANDNMDNCEDYQNQLDELIKEKADMCTEIEALKAEVQKQKLRADLNEEEYDSDTNIINNLKAEKESLTARLRKAERFILNSIYEKMEEE
ncbi:MAG: hypothetical protein MJ095_00030 [Oscillospiraceae bacterium]|nr:hypothetical protein [Oscillospiraceae bacterium]